MVLPDTLFLTELFFRPLQGLACPHLVDIFRPLCRVHHNGHTVVGYLNNAKSDYSPAPVCFPGNAKLQLTFLRSQDHGLPVRQDAYFSIMGRHNQRLTVSIIKYVVTCYHL